MGYERNTLIWQKWHISCLLKENIGIYHMTNINEIM